MFTNFGGVRPRVPARVAAVPGVPGPRIEDEASELVPPASTGARLLLNSILSAAPTDEERFG